MSNPTSFSFLHPVSALNNEAPPKQLFSRHYIPESKKITETMVKTLYLDYHNNSKHVITEMTSKMKAMKTEIFNWGRAQIQAMILKAAQKQNLLLRNEIVQTFSDIGASYASEVPTEEKHTKMLFILHGYFKTIQGWKNRLECKFMIEKNWAYLPERSENTQVTKGFVERIFTVVFTELKRGINERAKHAHAGEFIRLRKNPKSKEGDLVDQEHDEVVTEGGKSFNALLFNPKMVQRVAGTATKVAASVVTISTAEYAEYQRLKNQESVWSAEAAIATSREADSNSIGMCNASYLFDTLPELVVPMPVYYEPQITPPSPRMHQCDSRKTSTIIEMQPKSVEVLPVLVVPMPVYNEVHITPPLPRMQRDSIVTFEEGRQRQATASIDPNVQFHQQFNGIRDMSNEYSASQQPTLRIGAGKENMVDNWETLITLTTKNQPKSLGVTPVAVPTPFYNGAHITPPLLHLQSDPIITLYEGRQRQASASIDPGIQFHQQSNGLRDMSNEYSASQRQQPASKIGVGKENMVDNWETSITSTTKTQPKVCSKKSQHAPSYKDFKKNLSEVPETTNNDRAINQPVPKKRRSGTANIVQLKGSKIKKIVVAKNAKTAAPTSKEASSKQRTLSEVPANTEVARATNQPAPKKRGRDDTTKTVQLKISKLKEIDVASAETVVPTSKGTVSKQKKHEERVMSIKPAAKVTKKIAKAAQSGNGHCAHDIYQMDKTYYDITIAQELDYALKESLECALCYKEFGRNSNQIKPSKTRPVYACMEMRQAACNHAVCFQCFSGEIIKMDGLSRKRKATTRFDN